MMRKVSFKGLRLSFSRRSGRDKSPASTNSGETVPVPPPDTPTSNHQQLQPLAAQQNTVNRSQILHECNNQNNFNESNYVTTGEIQLPQRKEKHGIFGTIRRKLTASFQKRRSNSDENIRPRNNRGKKKGKKKAKSKHGGSRGVRPFVDKPIPSNTSEELSSEISIHPPPRSTRPHLHVSPCEKPETHSSCSSDSCDHDLNGSRCSKISVNVHSYENSAKLGHRVGNTSPSVSALRKVDYSSPRELLLCTGTAHTSVMIKTPIPTSTRSSSTSDAESSDNRIAPAIPPRPDMATNNHQQSVSALSQFNLMSFRTDNLLMMQRYEASLHSPVYDEVRDVPKIWSLTKELLKLSRFGWYWGPLTRVEAEEKLSQQPNGAFLVRDSSDDRYLLSLSFRSNERTLHTRIEHCNGMFSFYAQPELEGYTSIVDLIEHSMNDSLSGVFCYSRARTPGEPSFPVRLTKPVSRFTQVRSLQYLCRFVIRQYTRLDHIEKLPLPNQIKGWLEENQY